MSRKGLLINYEYCAGCHTCEVACMQENNLPVGKFGIRVHETVTETPKGIIIDNIPIPTALCNLCSNRTAKGELPSCVKHCQCGCMMYNDVTELAKIMEGDAKTVIFAPK